MWTEVDHVTMYLLILWQALLNGTAAITKLPPTYLHLVGSLRYGLFHLGYSGAHLLE